MGEPVLLASHQALKQYTVEVSAQFSAFLVSFTYAMITEWIMHFHLHLCCTMKKEAWKLLESEEQSLKLSNNAEANENA
jgi:hypothetical protein